jgi:hypothetical protein
VLPTAKVATGAPVQTVPARVANTGNETYIDVTSSGLRASVDAAASVFSSQELAGAALATSLLALVRVLSGSMNAGGASAALASAPQAPSNSKAPHSPAGFSWQAYLDAAVARVRVLRSLSIAWPTGPRYSMEYAPVPPPP